MKLNKQYVRNYISFGASLAEIAVSILILIGILFLSSRVFYDLGSILQNMGNPDEMITTETFLAHSIELIIGIEFVKMLVKHTASSAVEVLVFTIARLIVTSHSSMLDVLVGVIAIALLFIVKNIMSNSVQQTNQNEFVVNAGFSLEEVNKQFGISIDPKYGNTVAGIVANIAIKNNETLKAGYRARVDNHVFEVYSMDAHLIKQVKIIPNN